MDNATALQFRDTMDSLEKSQASIAALIDLAEGNPLSVFADPWIYSALKSRELVIIDWHYDETGLQLMGSEIRLTDYGKEFVAWMRQPREVSQQLTLFD